MTERDGPGCAAQPCTKNEAMRDQALVAGGAQPPVQAQVTTPQQGDAAGERQIGAEEQRDAAQASQGQAEAAIVTPRMSSTIDSASIGSARAEGRRRPRLLLTRGAPLPAPPAGHRGPHPPRHVVAQRAAPRPPAALRQSPGRGGCLRLGFQDQRQAVRQDRRRQALTSSGSTKSRPDGARARAASQRGQRQARRSSGSATKRCWRVKRARALVRSRGSLRRDVGPRAARRCQPQKSRAATAARAGWRAARAWVARAVAVSPRHRGWGRPDSA